VSQKDAVLERALVRVLCEESIERHNEATDPFAVTGHAAIGGQQQSVVVPARSCPLPHNRHEVSGVVGQQRPGAGHRVLQERLVGELTHAGIVRCGPHVVAAFVQLRRAEGGEVHIQQQPHRTQP
jgi:hypothetical protein